MCSPVPTGPDWLYEVNYDEMAVSSWARYVASDGAKTMARDVVARAVQQGFRVVNGERR